MPFNNFGLSVSNRTRFGPGATTGDATPLPSDWLRAGHVIQFWPMRLEGRSVEGLGWEVSSASEKAGVRRGGSLSRVLVLSG